MKVKRGLLIGRMQPVHNGHVEIIKKIFNLVDELIIGIGSGQISHEINNPFTAGERVLMLQNTLKETEIPSDSYYIIPIVDINNNSLWATHVESLIPEFNVVFSGNPLVKRLFKENNYDVKTPPLFDRTNLSGRKIRNKMVKGKNWQSCLPESVVKIIKEIDGINRLKEINKKEINE
ncbi:nicotinamide-nucleotide adenylyltransferase [Methanobrevibacter curvatus]|jgi:nicotinamide-nucleotide adenylyltransferase|uniref:Nicotinamide-nucleotide adenylyltransferase n=1 Tax=Methanobrevibacter curvatus TaxID=49547 RepID=A0A166CAQ4_9EURY|nr:nicotinamide-nucleotide adenylyltransferase [Methanobrevibacter curvatus]KZX12737.1 bifunctional NMN adenylyltransferase/nudix hydrolase [Methanobrevibacter curvatus]MDR3063000.1 nicotinamide-nucleotide adenylyltransferase [Methanobrevibacter sp.]